MVFVVMVSLLTFCWLHKCCEKQEYFLCILSGILATLRQFVKSKRPLTLDSLGGLILKEILEDDEVDGNVW